MTVWPLWRSLSRYVPAFVSLSYLAGRQQKWKRAEPGDAFLGNIPSVLSPGATTLLRFLQRQRESDADRVWQGLDASRKVKGWEEDLQSVVRQLRSKASWAKVAQVCTAYNVGDSARLEQQTRLQLLTLYPRTNT